MSAGTRALPRRFLVAAALVLPLLAGAARASGRLRAVRELRIKTPEQRGLSRLLERVRKSRGLIDAEVRARTLTAEEGARLRVELAALEKKARALAKKSRRRLERGVRSLDMELDEIAHRFGA